jgi:Tfp pilus assembly protein PilF
MRGVMLERSRQVSSALQSYERARQLDPAEKDYLVAEAECLVALGRTEEARQRVLEAIDDFERDGTLDTLVAEISMLLGQDEDAAAAFRRAMPLLGENDLVAEEFGLLLVRMDRFAEAVSVLQPLFERAGDETPGLVVRALARSHLELGRADTAEQILRDRLRKRPEDGEAWLLRAEAAIGCRDIAAAERHIEAALRLAPGDQQAHLLHGYVAWRQGALAEAAASLRKSLELDPDNVLAHCLMGQALVDAGHISQAREHWRRALQIDPGSHWAKAGLDALEAAR